jgi:hypothetical protein
MKTGESQNEAWPRLARLGAQAPQEAAEMPFGFATRVVAAWKSSPGEGWFAALEGLTWRGLAVASGILGVCAVLGYESLVSAFSGDASQAGSYLSDLLGL